MDMPLPNCKKELQSFLDIVNYMSKFSPMPAEVSKPLWKLTSVKADFSLNGMHLDLYNKAKI